MQNPCHYPRLLFRWTVIFRRFHSMDLFAVVENREPVVVVGGEPVSMRIGRSAGNLYGIGERM